MEYKINPKPYPWAEDHKGNPLPGPFGPYKKPDPKYPDDYAPTKSPTPDIFPEEIEELAKFIKAQQIKKQLAKEMEEAAKAFAKALEAAEKAAAEKKKKKRKPRKKKVVPPPIQDDHIYEREV